MHSDISSSLSRHRYKEALRTAMKVAQYGNQIIQAAEPWKYLSRKSNIHWVRKATNNACVLEDMSIFSHYASIHAV